MGYNILHVYLSFYYHVDYKPSIAPLQQYFDGTPVLCRDIGRAQD